MLSLLSEYQVSVNENSIPRVSFGNVSLQYLKYTIFPMLYFYETMKFNFLIDQPYTFEISTMHGNLNTGTLRFSNN